MEDIRATVNKIQEKGFLVSTGTIDRLKEVENINEITGPLLNHLENHIDSKKMIESSDIDRFLENYLDTDKEVEIQGTLYKPLAKEYEPEIDVMNQDISTQSESTGKVKDFVENFKSRYEKIHEILRTRGENSAIKIENVENKKNNEIKVIGLVTEKRTTKNGHIFMVIEDTTGEMKSLVPSNKKELKKETEIIVNDEVLGLEGRMSNSGLFIIENIIHPDVPIREVKKTEEDLAIATTSDLHIGSNLFMKKNFKNFIEWIKGKRGSKKYRELAGKVKYLTIAGDIVDGVGVYPGQEEELEITDIHEQYQEFAKYIKQIPSHIEVIIGTGNHDAVNKADPQPKLDPILVEDLKEVPNITLIGSPSLVKLHGLKTLIYHGTSFDETIAKVPEFNYENIREVMKKNLKCRHVHPIYGEKPITPEKEDQLVIEEAPDIYHAGHVHKNDYDKYKGTICVNSGTWQKTTPYQKKLGHKPTPGKLPVIETKKGKIKVLRFDKGISD